MMVKFLNEWGGCQGSVSFSHALYREFTVNQVSHTINKMFITLTGCIITISPVKKTNVSLRQQHDGSAPGNGSLKVIHDKLFASGIVNKNARMHFDSMTIVYNIVLPGLM